MNIIVFFSNAEELMKYLSLSLSYDSNEIRCHYISTIPLSENDVFLLQTQKISYIDTVNLKSALLEASQLIGGLESVITTVDVIPRNGWIEALERGKLEFTDMGAAIGRWYRDIKPERMRLKTKNFGVKYIDYTPNLINEYIEDHNPSSLIHAKKITKFPVFFNWFSKESSGAVKNCLQSSNDFVEFSGFLSSYYSQSSNYMSMYYLNDLELLDSKLMK